MSFFENERSWWEERGRPNVLFVHYADLKADLDGEMRRIAGFLDIAVPRRALARAGRGGGVRGDAAAGDALLGGGARRVRGRRPSFFHHGENGRWRGVFRDDDLARYDAKLAALPAGCAAWIGGGREAVSPSRPAPCP